MKTKEEVYKEYSDDPIKWIKKENCLTTKDIILRLMQIYHEQKNNTK